MPIVVENLTHVYAAGTPFETRALDNINLTVNDGEFVGLIGHTGSGKSTLIQHLNAIMKPTSGRVLVDGEDINEGANKVKVRRKVGLVFQYPEYQLFEETVEKDVSFGPGNLKLEQDEIDRRVRDALITVGLDESHWKKSPFELSGGQKRRAAIAGVLAMQPKVLILDEPAAGLDPAGRSEMRKMIRRIRDTGATVIMVSHSMDDVARMCERIIVMNKGRIALDGSPEKVFSNSDLLDDMHLGLPAAARLRDRLNARGFSISSEVYTIERLRDAILELVKKG